MEPEQVPDSVAADAVGSTSEAAKKRAAAPDWSDLIDTFGEQGARRDEQGRVVGYEYPKPKDDDERRQINGKVYEMWNPHRRVATELGANKSAKTAKQMVKIKTGNGTVREALPDQAEKVDRIASTGRIRSLWTRKYSEAPYWKAREERNGG